MQGGPVGWDLLSVDYSFDLPTKLTAMYLAASVFIFLALTIRFLPRVVRFNASVAALRAIKNLPAGAQAQEMNETDSVKQRFEVAYRGMQAALMTLRKWTQLTMLILLAYSANELAGLLRGISAQKMIGISALSGSLTLIFSMWTVGLCFLAVLLIANWTLSARLTHCSDIRWESFR
jgi:hypothetical protein